MQQKIEQVSLKNYFGALEINDVGDELINTGGKQVSLQNVFGAWEINAVGDKLINTGGEGEPSTSNG